MLLTWAIAALIFLGYVALGWLIWADERDARRLEQHDHADRRGEP